MDTLLLIDDVYCSVSRVVWGWDVGYCRDFRDLLHVHGGSERNDSFINLLRINLVSALLS